jgi:long-chain acyl-CoA synthetase
VAQEVERRQPEFWAAGQPDQPAVVDGDTILTYGQWNERADCLAAAVEGLRLARPSVGVRMHQSPSWFVINLALAKLGFELIALNWRLTAHEVRDIVTDSALETLFLDDEDPGPVRDALAGGPTRLILVGAAARRAGDRSFAAMTEGPRRRRYASREAVSMVVYSSGTTGRPKGVRNPVPPDEAARRTLMEYLGTSEQVSAEKAAHMVAVPRTLLTLPLHHGIGPKSARTCHERGGTVYLLDRFDPVRALEIIERRRITHWTTVPTMLQQIRMLPAEVLGSVDVSSVRVIALGSAPSSAELRDWVRDYFGDCLYEGYGAAEVGMVTYMRPRWRAAKPGSCGRPRRHVSVRILGPDGTPVPPGQEGEIYVRTPVTISSYVNQAALGADTLSEDGHFRTGDYGKLDEDGFLYITGRVKDMIIAGGVNIFPAEIELALADHPDVVEAAVFGVPEETFGEQVMAVCETRPGSTVRAEELLTFIARRLAPFKRPRIIELVDELPRNAMNKVVKAELRQPFWEGRAGAI